MPSFTVNFEPVRDGYSAVLGYDVLETKLDGGKSRKRKDILNSPHYVKLNWILTSAAQYSEFMAIFRNSLNEGTDDFYIDLLTDVGELTKHVARCVGGMPKLTQNRGNAYYVEATLEVDKNPTFTAGFLATGTTDSLLGAYDFDGHYQIGDTVRLFHAIGTHVTLGEIDMSGQYVIAGVSGTTLTLNNPGSVNANWTDLASATPPSVNTAVASTITRVP